MIQVNAVNECKPTWKALRAAAAAWAAACALLGSTYPLGRPTEMACPSSCTWLLSCSAAVAISGVRSSTKAYRPSECMDTFTTGVHPGCHGIGKGSHHCAVEQLAEGLLCDLTSHQVTHVHLHRGQHTAEGLSAGGTLCQRSR